MTISCCFVSLRQPATPRQRDHRAGSAGAVATAETARRLDSGPRSGLDSDGFYEQKKGI